MTRIRRALISVYYKDGLIELAEFLRSRGVDILSSGGTRKILEEEGIPCRSVTGLTGFPEILGGRVKTLHPKVFGGILHKEEENHLKQIAEHDIEPIDLVVVNLYPFEETIAKEGCTEEEAIEKIDIGGPSLIRAAAKNFYAKTVLVSPQQYPDLIAEMKTNEGGTSQEFRKKCALRAFQHTARYNTVISEYLARGLEKFPGEFNMQGIKLQDLRYGENPHQKAAFYSFGQQKPLNDYVQLHGKELSYNNILDLDAALAMVREFEGMPFVTILKHNNPCGAAQDFEQIVAYKKALASDPVSAFGGIVGFNQTVTEQVAEEMRSHFFECIIAPDYTDEALAIFEKKKNLRLLKYSTEKDQEQGLQIRTVRGGFLVQSADELVTDLARAKVVSKRRPDNKEMQTLEFAWKMCKHVHSNAIVFARDNQLIGVGAGQMSRVDAAELAITKAGGAKNSTEGTVVASDAFFPFRDGIDVIAAAGATAVVQPGGSIRDEEVIAAIDEHKMTMIFTGNRHFKH